MSRLAELRTARGWTQQQLADKSRISRRSIQLFEREGHVPKPLLQQSLAKTLRVSIADLGFDELPEGGPLVP